MNPIIADLADLLDLDAATATAMGATIEQTLSPASTIRAQLLVTVANLSQAFPEIDSKAHTIFAVVVLQAHPFFVGQKVFAA